MHEFEARKVETHKEIYRDFRRQRYPHSHTSRYCMSTAMMETSTGNHKTAAADLIRSIDTAFAKVSSSSVDAARDAEEARRNARIASELARKYRSQSSSRDAGLFTFSSASPSKHGSYSFHANGAGPSTPESLKKRRNTAASPAARLAKSNAEDVLTLSLEVERVKRSLESEELSHDETKSELSQSKAKNAQLEAQIEKMLNDMETQREQNGRCVDALEQELSLGQVRVDAAEEDAILALDLAKSSAEGRQELEVWLEKALEEVQLLREHVAGGTTPVKSRTDDASLQEPSSSPTQKQKHVVRFAESPTFYSDQPPTPVSSLKASPASRPSRSMVSVGRQLMQRTLSADSNDDSTYSVSPSNSLEKRKKLLDRLKAVDAQNETPASIGLHSSPRHHDKSALEIANACRSAARILKESGERLNLSGRWWGEGSDSASNQGDHVEILARHYCTSVEVS